MKPDREKQPRKKRARTAGGIVFLFLILSSALAGSARAQDMWRTVQIEMNEYRFHPDKITLKAGEPVRIELHNIGNEDHEFRSRLFDGPLIDVEGNGVTVSGTGIKSVLVDNGATAAIKWLSPEPGTYVFECRIPSHHGMDGVIVVEKAGGKPADKENSR
jgi:uncharacterized cupredoxin-like copper-binding protein